MSARSNVAAADVAVLVSVRIDPVSGRAPRRRADAAGVALAQKALGNLAAAGTAGVAGPVREPLLCTAGDMPGDVARDYLAQGITRLTRLPLRAGATLDDAVEVLARTCGDCAVLLAGARAESGLGSGLLPYALAQRLHRPVLNEVIDLQREADGGWRVVQALPRGARRSWRLAPGATVVLVTSPRLVQREDLPQRHSWVAAQAGRVVEPATALLPAAASAPSWPSAEWRFEPARRQRRALAPVSVESGAARMAKATGAGESAKGGAVLRDGTTMDKARLLLDHLRKLALVQP